jgi:hypothetical protein
MRPASCIVLHRLEPRDERGLDVDAGDVRAESIKRVASAVGEGAMAVRFVHEHRGGR